MECAFSRKLRLPHSARSVFDWHARPGAFERLTPPWSGVRVVARNGGIENGATVDLRMPVGPLSVRWLAEHGEPVPGREFVDFQRIGPFSSWVHTHRFDPSGENESILEDSISYRLPGGPLGHLAAGRFVRNQLERTFAYRHRITASDLEAHAACLPNPMTVVVTGASGLVGSTLVPFLRTGGHRVIEIGRSWVNESADRVRWNPASGDLDAGKLAGTDAVVHLAGDSISAGRWSAARKKEILESRVRSSRLLAERVASMRERPRVLVSASAIGLYGDRADQLVTEDDAGGGGFLADVCRAWESALDPARDAGVRVVCLRIGVVLSARGGALARMLLPFSIGAGGVLGAGSQYMSWIGLEDLVRLIHHVAVDSKLSGPVNAVAPNPVTNREFTRTLSRVLRRPAVLPVPAVALRVLLGEMADALLLSSSRVASTRLAQSGFEFGAMDLETALRCELGRVT